MEHNEQQLEERLLALCSKVIRLHSNCKSQDKAISCEELADTAAMARVTIADIRDTEVNDGC